MPGNDARDSEPAAPATPRVSGEQLGAFELATEPLPQSSQRSLESSPDSALVSEPGDTLLSAGKPAERWELVLEDRMGVLDRRLEELETRLASLERKRPRDAAGPVSRPKPWLWIAFLIGVAIVFQLLRRVR
jgi:hypothetical protein